VRNSDRAWQLFGETEPYGAVAGSSRYNRAELDTRRLGEFFETGERYIAELFRVVAGHLDSGFRPRRALDYGCGVGRMLVPLAARCDEVIGVDVADSMLAEAAKHCAPLDNVKLLKGDDSLSRIDGTFDLIHSSYVLLHVPTSRGEVIVERLAEKLAQGGVAVLEFPLGWHVAKWRKAASWARRKVPGINGFANLVRRRPLGYPLMQLNLYSMNRLFDIMNRHGCATVFISLELDQSVLSATAFFLRA